MFFETGLKDISSKLGLQTIQVSASNSIAIFWQRLQFVHTRGSMDIFGSEGSSGFIRFPGTQILKFELEEGKNYMEEALDMIKQQNEPVFGVASPSTHSSLISSLVPTTCVALRHLYAPRRALLLHSLQCLTLLLAGSVGRIPLN